MTKRLLLSFFIPVACSAQTWLQLPDFPDLGRDDGVAVTLNNQAYFGSGLRSDWSYGGDFYRLDPTGNTWSAIAALPAGAQRQYACAFAGPGCFYVFAGDGPGGPLNNLYKYTAAGNSWSTAASKPGNPVFGAACMEFGDKIIIVGGKAQGNASANSEVWEYTISSDSWQQKNNFPYGGRFRASAAAHNNSGYLMFGIDDNNKCRKEMYRYDPSNDSWTLLPDIPDTYGRAYATLKSIDDKLILFGGYDSLNVYYKSVWYYKPADGSWQQQPDFPAYGRKGGMGAVIGNTFYYSCGINLSNLRNNETWMLTVPVGLREYRNEAQFSVYPNPCNNMLSVDLKAPAFNSSDLQVCLSDLSGRRIKEFNCANAGRCQLSLETLEQGCYLLSMYSGNRLLGTRRVIKN